MRFGELDHRLVLQAPTVTRGAAGGVAKSFTTDSTVWGSIKPLSGKEYLVIGQTQNQITNKIVIRYHATIRANWRIVDAGDSPQTIYTIHFIDKGFKRQRMMTLLCSEGVQTA